MKSRNSAKRGDARKAGLVEREGDARDGSRSQSYGIVCEPSGGVHHRRFDSAGARPRRHGSPTCAPPAAAKDDERMTEARKQFQAGVNLLDDPDGAKYELAYHAFHRAYELSHSAKVLGNIGLCALHLERDGEAIDAYSMYLRDAPDVSDREKVQIQRDLATLSSTAVQLKATVKKPGSGFTLVDNRIQTSGGSIVNSYPSTKRVKPPDTARSSRIQGRLALRRVEPHRREPLFERAGDVRVHVPRRATRTR